MRVLMVPAGGESQIGESGIRRVVEAYTRYLTQMGVKFVGKGDSYDLKAVHAGSALDADVAHCHGLYWTADYPADTWEWKANTYVTVAVRSAKAVTVPSSWVAETFQRDMRFTPDVVGHGIEWQEWQHSEKPQNYVLWNKNRIGDVCDIEPFAHLARTFSNIQFVSTFMPRSGTSNIKSTGVVAHSEMKRIVQRAGVYLATTKETFGIGVLEAMACFPAETRVEASGVIRCTEKLYSGPLITVTTGRASIRVTPEHPFWTNRGWVLAKDLHLEHQLCYTGSYKICEGVLADGCAEEVHTGTFGEVFRTVQNNVSERSCENVGDRRKDAWWYISPLRNQEATVGIYTPTSGKPDINRTGVHSRNYRWGGNCNYSHDYKDVQGNDIQKMGSNDSDIEYVFGANGMAGKDVEQGRSISFSPNIQREARKSKELLSVCEGINSVIPIQSLDSISDNKKKTHGTHCGVGGIKIGWVQGRTVYDKAKRDSYDDSRSQYEAIEKITSESVVNLLVYNFTTLSGTYLAEGYVVHNCGVPVLGYAHGGIADLIQHGVNGYLAQPGNLEDLEQGLNYCIENAETLGDNGRELAKGYSWGKAAEKIYKIYDRVLHPEPPTVSIVIPSFNYASKVETAIQSALAQTAYLRDVIVVDDGSKDDGLTERTVSAIDDKRVRFYRKENGGVATARNYGIARSDSKYICCLDADDKIEPSFLEALVPSLESSAGLGIAYSGLQYVLPDGRTGLSDWPGDWDFDEHLKRKNQIPTCCVFRKTMWERLGGYRQRYAPQGQGAEDAEFWLRAGAYGWGAKKATKEGLFVYSWMSGRASGNKDYKEVDWLELHPWTKDGKHPFASHATPVKWSHPVRQYDEPRVSVIIPVGPGHEHLLIDALDSLEAQTYRKWEVIVVWDSYSHPFANDINYEIAYPYVKWVWTTGGVGAGKARNLGAKIARGNLLLFLDADDFLLPQFLERTVQVYDSTEAAVYTDYEGWAIVDDASKLAPDLRANMRETSNGITKIGYRAAEYNCERAQRQPEAEPYLWCDINTLHPKLWYNELGGFDESLDSWEDVDYWWRMARAGHCFQRIPQELFVYRFHTGTRRQKGLDNWKSIVDILTQKYEGEKAMGCGGCGGGKHFSSSPPMQQENAKTMQISDEEMILILYMHPNIGQHPVIGPATKTFYGYRGRGEEFLVHRADVLGRPNVFVPIPLNTADVPEMQAAPLPPKRITVDTSEKDGVVSIPIVATGVTVNESLANAMAAMEQALTKPPSSVMVAESHEETSVVKRPKGRPRTNPVI